MSGAPEQVLVVTLPLHPGDALLVYTDGVTDAVNRRTEMYGRTRLQSALSAAPQSAQPLLNHILADLAQFTGDTPQQDDITLFALTAELE